jgi:serine/threonine protein kinase
MTESEFFTRFTYNPKDDVIGSGGFGTVYRAYDEKEKHYVALKISQVKDIHGKFSLLNEVDLSRQIDHHVNVARYDFGFRAIHPFQVDYAVMDYYEAGNLDLYLRTQQNVLPEAEIWIILEGILQGILHLHHEGVIHRDLKLANILIHRTKQGVIRPKIADFGLSRMVSSHQEQAYSNSALGLSIAYAAPEQLENKPIRKNVDLWAFGVIVYRMLTGEMPFKATNGADSTHANVEISRQIVKAPFPERLNTIPEPFQAIIRRCWVRNPEQRAQSAEELLEILKQQTPIIPKEFEKKSTAIAQNVQKSTNSFILPLKLMGLLLGMLVIGYFSRPFFSKKTTSTVVPNPELGMRAFQSAQKQGTLTAWRAFVKDFPSSDYRNKAQQQIDSLENKKNIYIKDANVMAASGEPEAAAHLYIQALAIQPDDADLQKKIQMVKPPR